MTRRLTKKQKGFVKDYVANGGNGTLAAIKNYDVSNKETAAVISSENLIKPNVINAIEEALPDELLAKRHKELLNKREIIKMFGGEGKIINEPDTQAVSKGLEMAYKIKGYFAPEKHLNINTTAEELRELIKHELARFRS